MGLAASADEVVGFSADSESAGCSAVTLAEEAPGLLIREFSQPKTLAGIGAGDAVPIDVWLVLFWAEFGAAVP